MGLFNAFGSLLRKPRREVRSSKRTRTLESCAEVLESRVVLYSTSGNLWPAKDLITISFMPDGTNLGGATNNLQSTFNTKFGTAATWQNQILKAAQYWAQQTNINFAVVTDNGAAAGSGSYQQGDPNFGDIRIGGFNFGNSTLAQAYLPPPINNYSIAGDIQINTGATFNVGSQYDLFTVMVHEFGHALGLNHATATTACMYATYNGVDAALNADDISGIKAIYSAGAARAADSQEANETTSAAKTVTLNATTKAAVVNDLNLTTSTDLDYFKIVVPTGATTTLKATVVSTGLSLLSPKVEIIVGSTTKATGAAGATEYGSSETATYTNATDLAAGNTVYIKVSSANSVAAFKTGKYALVLNMGTGADPAYTKPNTTKVNGSPLSSGGGVALKLGVETAVNAASTDIQQTSDRAVGMSALGASVVTWASQNQDGSGWGVYAQRYGLDGSLVGSAFLVNSTTVSDQIEPSVAVDPAGNFWIAWTSASQDGNGYGIYARHYDLLGNPLGSEFRVNTTTANDQTAPSVAVDYAGTAIFTWTSNGQDGNGSGIYAQRYNFLGLPVGGEFRVNTATAGDQSDASVAVTRDLLNNDYVIAWTSAGQDGSGAGIYAQRYLGSTGAASGTEFRVNTTTANDQTDASVAVNRFNSNFVVTWTSVGQDKSGKGIYAQRYNSAGVAQGSQFLVNTSTAGDQYDSTVAIDGAGEIFAMWTNAGVTGSGLQVYGQQFDVNGAKKEGEFVVNTTTASDQSAASVSIDTFGRVIVAWTGNGTGDSNGVYFQRYRTDLHPFSADEHEFGHDGADEHDGDLPPPVVATSPSLPVDGTRDDQRLQVVTVTGVLHHGSSDALLEGTHGWTSSTTTAEWLPPAPEGVDRESSDDLSAGIDSVFGSADWLAGRFYRGVNGRV